MRTCFVGFCEFSVYDSPRPTSQTLVYVSTTWGPPLQQMIMNLFVSWRHLAGHKTQVKTKPALGVFIASLSFFLSSQEFDDTYLASVAICAWWWSPTCLCVLFCFSGGWVATGREEARLLLLV
jgi:hypothetical protein